MLQITENLTLFSKRDAAGIIAAEMAYAVRSQAEVMAEDFHQGDYDNGWLATFKAAQAAANAEYLKRSSGLLNQVPYLTRREVDLRLALFVDVQRVRAKLAFRRTQSGSDQGALDAWSTWAVLDDAPYATL